MNLYLFQICLFFCVAGSSLAAESTSTYITASSLYARSIAMGGAFTAFEAGVENALYNPASMGLGSRDGNDFSIYLNPVGGAGAIYFRSELSSRPRKDAYDWLNLIGLFARAVSYSKTIFQASIILSEELVRNPLKLDNGQFISTQGLLDWNYHTAALRVTLAKQVSLGVTGYAFNLVDESGELNKSAGSSYGILMKPSDNVSAGVSYFNFPDRADSLMFAQHRIHNNSINIGVVYRPINRINLALDFRNVSEDDNNSTNEVHAGVEFITARFLALRTGYFRQNIEKIDTFSAGFGISDFRPYRSETDPFVFSNIILNYGLQVAKEMNDLDFVHYLTFLIRF